MINTARFAEVAALAGDPARAAILHALMDGRALTAAELARVAGITPQTASVHLARLTAAGLLSLRKQGRHRYHSLASATVAHMMEGIMQVASNGEPPVRKLSIGPRDAALRAGRTCYDHLAGRLGVALADALVGGGYVELESDAGLLTERGLALFSQLNIDLDGPASADSRPSRRVLCRPCLDWSERRPHIGGRLGAALWRHCLTFGWVRRMDGSRAVAVTPKGVRLLRQSFGLRLD